MSKRKIWMQGIGASVVTMALFAVITPPSLNKKAEPVYYSIESAEEAAPAPSADGEYEYRSIPDVGGEPKVLAPSWDEIVREFVHQGIPYFFMIVQAGIGAVTAKRLRKAKKEEKNDS